MPHKKVIYRNKETPFEIKSEGDWKKIKKSWTFLIYVTNVVKDILKLLLI